MSAHDTTPAERVVRLGRHAQAFLLPALIMAAVPTPLTADASVSVDVGMRFLDEKTWDPLDNQETRGLQFNYARPGWPVGLAFGWHTSDGEQKESEFVPDGGGGCIIPFLLCYRTGETIEWTAVRSSLRELSLGVSKAWISEGSNARGYVGGGVSQVRASIDSRLAGFNDSDRTAGFWAHAGILRALQLSEKVYLEFGIELRALQGTRLRLGGERGDADYVQLGLISGMRW